MKRGPEGHPRLVPSLHGFARAVAQLAALHWWDLSIKSHFSNKANFLLHDEFTCFSDSTSLRSTAIRMYLIGCTLLKNAGLQPGPCPLT